MLEHGSHVCKKNLSHRNLCRVFAKTAHNISVEAAVSKQCFDLHVQSRKLLWLCVKQTIADLHNGC